MLAKHSYNAVLTAATVNGTSVDTQGYRRAAFVSDAATGAATTANFQLQESSDNVTWTNVAGATLATAVPASTTQVNLVDIDLAKRQRYLRAQQIGTGTAGTSAGVFVLYNASNQAVTQDQTALSV